MGQNISRKVASGRWVAGAIRSLVNTRDLQLECARVLYEKLHCLFLCMVVRQLWKDKEISRNRAIQMDNIRGLISIRRIDMVPNGRLKEFCGVKKGLDERIDEGVLWCRGIGLPKEYM